MIQEEYNKLKELIERFETSFEMACWLLKNGYIKKGE